MFFQKIEELNVFYLSSNSSGLGSILCEGTLLEILTFVQMNLFNENTDYQNDATFQDLGSNGVVTQVGHWYAIELNSNLYQIILTEDNVKYNLPQNQTWTGSITDLIDFLLNRLQ